DKLVTGVQTCALPIWIRRPAGAPRVLTVERPVLQRRLELRLVLVEAEHERAVGELTGRRGHLLVAVEERPLHARAAAGDFHSKRHLDAVDDDGRAPEPRE